MCLCASNAMVYLDPFCFHVLLNNLVFLSVVLVQTGKTQIIVLLTGSVEVISTVDRDLVNELLKILVGLFFTFL